MGKGKKEVVSEENIKFSDLQSRWDNLFNGKTISFNDTGYMSTNPSGFGSSFLNNPFLQNQRLKSIPSKSSPIDKETLNKAVKNSENSEQTLRSASWDISSNSYIYYKLLRLYMDIPSYNTYAYPKYVPKEDMKKPRFKSDSKIVHMFLDKFNPKLTFKRISMDVKREGKVSYVYRQSACTNTGYERFNYAELQRLPSDHIKYTSLGSDTPLVTSFNFMLFFNPAWSLDHFPPIFRQYYEEMTEFVSREQNGRFKVKFDKLPNNVEFEIKNNNYFFWRELPQELVFCFASDLSHAWQIPDTVGLLAQFNDLADYKWLQGALASSPLTNILVGEVPLAEVKAHEGFTDIALNPDVVDGFIDLYNSLAPGNSAGYFAPFKNFQLLSFPHIPDSNDIYTNAIQDTLSSAGVSGIMSTESKPSVAMVKSSQLLISAEIEFITKQFEKFLNVVFENHLDLKYTWRANIWGNIFTEKDEISTIEKQLSLGVSALYPKLLSAHGLDIESSDCINDWMDSTKTYDKFKQMVSAFQTNQKEEVGRKKADENNLESDNTDSSIGSGQNTSDAKFSFDVCIKCHTKEIDDNYKYFCDECGEEYLEELED